MPSFTGGLCEINWMRRGYLINDLQFLQVTRRQQPNRNPHHEAGSDSARNEQIWENEYRLGGYPMRFESKAYIRFRHGPALMLKTLRTYRAIALLTAFALVATAFAPLSSLCGMDLSEPIRVSDKLEAPVTPPCHDTGGMGMDDAVPMEKESPGAPDDPSDVVFTLSCCIAQGLTAPQTERPAKPTAGVTEAVTNVVNVDVSKVCRQITADGLPPPLPVARHLLFGCFLT